MTDAIPIYQGQDFYVPRFKVTLGQRDLPQSVIYDVMQVSYKDNLEEIDSFEITINNWDADTRDFKYTDQVLFDPGKELKLEMGYLNRGAMRTMINGQIISLRPSYPTSGQPTMVISGLNLLHTLRTKQESHIYEGISENDIAQQIAGRLGVSLRLGGGSQQTFDYLFQDNQYDIVFLKSLARRVGYDLFVEESVGDSQLYFGPSEDQQRPTYQLSYGKSLIQFQPNLTTANQVAKVTVRGWDEANKTKIEATVDRSQLTTRAAANQADQQRLENAFADREEVITDQPVESNEEAQTLARRTLENISKDTIKGNGSTVGLPDLRSGQAVTIDGLGRRFSGRYFITATTHSIANSGYTTQFQCRKEEL